jgi:protoheme ferro-lyase
MTTPVQAVLLVAHGTPEKPEDVPAYMRNVTSGREIPEAVMQEVKHRYGIIGRSPLTDITMQQAQALAKKVSLPVYVGMRNWKPYIADTVKEMIADGISHAAVICLAPQNSRTSVGLYKRAVLGAAGDSLAALVAKQIQGMPEWRFAFQSQGMSGGAWIGPTVEATIDSLRDAGHKAVIIQPIGFVCDHVEVLYDIDILFKKYAQERGMKLFRTESLNTSPEFIDALAALARSRIGAQPASSAIRSSAS